MSDQWATAQRLIGRWEGTATGKPGEGAQVRTYAAALRGGFIMGTNRTIWEPTAEEPDGEIHEDINILSFDRGGGTAVMRSFFVEGFACEYRCVDSADGVGLVFRADVIENGPPGMRARETISLVGDDRLESVFELAMRDGPFEPYSSEVLHRVGD